MDIRKMFPSKWLSAIDLDGKAYTLTIERVTVEELQGQHGPEEKPAVWFKGSDKALILNRTNTETIMSAYGPNTDGWVNQKVELYPTEVQAFGKPIQAIRIRIPKATAPPIHAEAPVKDEVPF